MIGVVWPWLNNLAIAVHPLAVVAVGGAAIYGAYKGTRELTGGERRRARRRSRRERERRTGSVSE